MNAFWASENFEAFIAIDSNPIEARHVLLANGAEPRPMRITGAELLTTSDRLMALADLPARIVMVGGGYIATEFSHLAAHAGAEVTVLEHGPRMLSHFEPEQVDALMRRFAHIGVDVRTQSEVTAVERKNARFVVWAKQDGQQQQFDADLVVHAAGRVPALNRLDLAAGNIASEDGRLKLNDHLQSTSNPRVYAAGDAAAKGPPLTPVASDDRKLVARNLLEGNRHKPNYRGVPSVAFTLPPIARVGYSEAEARSQGFRFAVKRGDASGWYSARRVNEPVYAYKTLLESGSGRILGAHVVGPEADALINIFALAIRHDLTAEDLKRASFAYPTAASDIASMV